MKLKMVLTESNKKIKDDILKIIFNHIDNAINSSLNTIKIKTQDILSLAMKNEPEYNSLKSGQLRMELGIEDTDTIDNIVDKITQTISITKTLKYNNKGLSGGIKITVLSDNELQSIMNSSLGNIEDPQRGYSLPWLEWLLTRGVSTIIKNYKVETGSYPNSRTGMAIMVRSDSDWQIPPQFAGTNDNNWITRAFSTCESQILSTIRTAIEQKI